MTAAIDRGGAVRKFVAAAVIGIALLSAEHAPAADTAMPTKAPPPAMSYNWTGFYLGGYFDYALGASHWSSTQAGVVGPNGLLNFSNAYNFSSGAGSYRVGLLARYDHMSASRWLSGLEADISFPSFVGGSRTFTSVSTGQANYLEQIEFSGTVRGRVGYAPGHWLFYATGGFAWSYDQFSRTQLAGVPVGGSAVPGTVETRFLQPRVGGVIGAGVEVALTPNWAARLEYLFTDYGSRSVTFPAAAQRFDSDLRHCTHCASASTTSSAVTASIRKYSAKAVSALELDRFALHGQFHLRRAICAAIPRTLSRPEQPRFPMPGVKAGTSRILPAVRLWQGAEFGIDPEIDQGFGLSNTEGVAGFPSGASFKVGSSVPYARISSEGFVRQTIDLGGEQQKVEADDLEFARSNTKDRLVITVGKYSRVRHIRSKTNTRRTRARTS